MMQKLNWKQLASLEVGGAICLPVIMVGHKLCISYGWISALLGILIGNFFLLLISYVTVLMSVKYRESTPENAKRYFGEGGAKLFACLLCVAKTSWFAIQLNMMVLSIYEILQIEIMVPLTIFLGAIIAVVAMKGIRALSHLSSMSLPILIFTMGMAVFLSVKNQSIHPTNGFSWGAISLAIGAAITAVIDMPTYFRHVVSIKDGLLAVTILFVLAVPLIEGLGVYLAYQNPAETVISTMMISDSTFWNLWVMLFMLLAGWTTNNTNLYSASVCLESIWKGASEKTRLIVIAGLGTTLALMHVLDHLTIFLQGLGIFVGSMGAVVLTNFILNTKSCFEISLLAWVFGIIMGLLNLFQLIALTPIAVLDAFLMATLLTCLGRGYEIINCRTFE